jgi:hypothetical protein
MFLRCVGRKILHFRGEDKSWNFEDSLSGKVYLRPIRQIQFTFERRIDWAIWTRNITLAQSEFKVRELELEPMQISVLSSGQRRQMDP